LWREPGSTARCTCAFPIRGRASLTRSCRSVYAVFHDKEPGHGTGLGLSITYSIVEVHGGHIAVERAARVGPRSASTCHALRRCAARLPLTDVEPPEPPTTKRRILLVDETRRAARGAGTVRARGHTVDVAATRRTPWSRRRHMRSI